MIVDDDAFFREVVAQALEKHYPVCPFANGWAAIQALQAGARPGLVITDLAMPLVDGYGLLAYLRERHSYSTVPVLIVSAEASSTTRIDCLQRGGDQFLSKPVNPQEICARVAVLLRAAHRPTDFRIGDRTAHRQASR